MPKSLRLLPLLMLLLCFAIACSHTETLVAQEQVNEKATVQFGFDGKVKLGSWTPVFVRSEQDLSPTSFSMTVSDSDGTPVTYTGPLNKIGQHYQFLARIGRTKQKISVHLHNESGESVLVVDNIQQTSDNYPEILKSTSPQILTIESNDQIKNAILATTGRSADEDQFVTSINQAEWLPASGLALQGINKMIISGTDAALVKSIKEQQWQAIDFWVKNGGSLVFCVGKNSEELFENKNGIARFLPGEFSGVGKMNSSSRIEFYVKSNDQLIGRNDQPIPVAAITNPTGVIELQQENLPLVVRKAHGFGQIVFSAVDIDLAPISDWPGQKNFLVKLLNQGENLNQSSGNESRRGRVSHFGYEDLVGQMLVPLEQFSKVKFVSFTWIAALIILYILCIGPGDFFLLKKLFKRMEMTWLTFTLMTLGFCGLAYAIAHFTRPTKTQVNQIEIVDIDAETGFARGNMWTNLFSPLSGESDVDTKQQNLLNVDTSNSCVCWHGLPGDSLGGMRSNTTTNFLTKPYRCDFPNPTEQGRAGDSQSINSKLVGMPLQVSSTKTLLTQWTANSEINVRSRLRLVPQIGRLQGQIANPFEVELRNCRVLFENWAYEMDQPLGPGESIDIEADLRERTASSYLTRRIRDKDKGVNAPWNPSETRIGRIADVMMFYSAAGGQEYTGLSHGYQGFLDMSNALRLKQAVLVGEIDEVCTELQFGDSKQLDYDQKVTFVRIVLPVEYRKSKKKKNN